MDSEFLAEYVHGRHTVREYFDRFIREPLIEAAFADCSAEFRSRCTSRLWMAFAQLDAIPRSDPFWAGSNLRTTFGKVCDHQRLTPPEDSDVEGSWASFVIALCSGDCDVFRNASEVLLRGGRIGVGNFLRTSLNLRDVSGWDTDELAASLLLRLELGTEARTTLDDIIEHGSTDRSMWATKVLQRVARALSTDDLMDRTKRALEGRGLDLCEHFVMCCGELEGPAPGRVFAQFAKNLADGDRRGDFSLAEFEAAYQRLLSRGLLTAISSEDLAQNSTWPTGRNNYHVGDIVLSEAGYLLHTEVVREIFGSRFSPKRFSGIARQR